MSLTVQFFQSMIKLWEQGRRSSKAWPIGLFVVVAASSCVVGWRSKLLDGPYGTHTTLYGSNYPDGTLFGFVKRQHGCNGLAYLLVVVFFCGSLAVDRQEARTPRRSKTGSARKQNDKMSPVTRKGRLLLARQERHDEEQTSPSIPSFRSWSGENKTTTRGKSSSSSCDETAAAQAANRGTVFFQHPVVHQPGRPTGSGYWQLSEREARQARLDRHRREAEASSWIPSDTNDAPPGTQQYDDGGPNPAHSQTLTAVVVTGELMDPLPQNDERGRSKRRCWIYGTSVLACCVLIALIVGIVVPLVFLKQANDGDESVVEPPVESVPTSSQPSDLRTLSPSMTPRGSSFVAFGDEYVGEQAGEMLGQSLAFVGDRWVAVGSPGHNGGAGLVRIWDIYNGTQIGQDLIVSNVSRVGDALSAEGSFLAFSGLDAVFVARYNARTGFSSLVWIIVAADEHRTISIDAPRINAQLESIGLAYTSVIGQSFVELEFGRFDSSGVYTGGSQSLVFPKASKVEAAFVGEDALVVCITRGSDSTHAPSVQAYHFELGSRGWERQTRFYLPESVTGGSRLLSTAYFHKADSTVVAYANVEQVTVVEIRADLSVTELGSPIVFAGQDEPFGTDLAISDEWLAVGRIVSGDLFVRIYRFEEEGDWFQQGNEIRIRMAGDRVSVAMGAPSLHQGVISPTVAVGLPRGVVTNAFVRSNTTVIAAGKACLFRRGS